MFNYPCVILCGGKSSRMGQDKTFLPYKNTNLINYQINKFEKIFNKVYINSKNNKFNFKNIILDEDKNTFSPMLALYSVLKSFNNTLVFIICVDMPNISENEIQKLLDFKNDANIIIPKTKDHKHSLCGFYHSSLANICKKFLDENKHKISLLFNEKTRFIEFNDENKFINLNFYKDYENWIHNE